MSGHVNRSLRTTWPWLALVVLWGGAFCIACRVATPQPGRARVKETSVAGAVAGGARIALGRQFYETADLYFHKGVEHVRAHAFTNSVFQRITERISPAAHVHAEGKEVREIMPWLWAGTRANPHDVEAYLVSAFWLVDGANRPDLAFRVLQEARENNPFSFRVEIARGRLLARQQNLDAAARAFDAALAFWPGGEDPESTDALAGRAEVLLYRARVHEAAGEAAPAAACLREILDIFPERTYIQRRIFRLEAGHIDSADDVWGTMRDDHEDLAGTQADDEHAHGHMATGLNR